jgi:RNA polymerase sigma-70 factor (ECF subfamily)
MESTQIPSDIHPAFLEKPFSRNERLFPGLFTGMMLCGNPPFDHPMEENQATTPEDRDAAIDHALMARIAGGDHQAFRALVERHQNSIVGTVTKMLGNTSDSEDIAQQVFIRVWKHAKRYRPDNKFTTYLYTITRNLVYNETRRRSRKKTVSTDMREDEHHLQHPDDESARPDASLLDSELREAIDAAIASLPENQRLAVVLRRYDNLPYEEIAAVLNTSVPSVKSLLFRARTTLRDSLEKYMEG